MGRLSDYELVRWHPPVPGDLYLEPGFGIKEWTAIDSYTTLGAEQRRYIIKPKEQKVVGIVNVLPPVVNITTSLEAPLSAVTSAEPQPVLVAEFFDADGNTSTNTFYDADLAARFYGRA